MYGPGGFAQLQRDQLYGSVIHVTQVNVEADGTYTADLFTYYAYRWVDVVDANAAKAKSGATAAFFKTLADGDDGVVRDKLIDAHLPKSQVTKYSSGKPFLVDDPGRGEFLTLWRFDPTENGDFSNPVQISVSDPYLLHDVPVGQLAATGIAIRPTKLSVNLDGPGTGYQD